MKEIIKTEAAPTAIGTYSQAVVIDRTVYISGQIGLIPETMQLVSGDFTQQAQQAFTNLEAVARAASGSMNDVVKLTVYLQDMTNFKQVNEIMATFCQAPYPARAAVAVAGLPKDALIEIDAIMVLPELEGNC